jgi:hypothetical protein
MAQANTASNDAMQQMGLYEAVGLPIPSETAAPQTSHGLAGCRAKEARYGFRPDGADDPTLERPRTLCFDASRRGHAPPTHSERMARGGTRGRWGCRSRTRSGRSTRLPGQIAARHALGVGPGGRLRARSPEGFAPGAVVQPPVAGPTRTV